MNKFFMTLKNSYKQKVTSKSFIFTTLLTVALIFLAFNFNTIIDLFNKSESLDTLTIQAEPELKDEFSSFLNAKTDTIKITNDSDNILKLTLLENTLQAELDTEHELKSEDKETIQNTLNQYNQMIVMKENNLDKSVIENLNSPVALETNVRDEDKKDKSEDKDINPINIGIMYLTLFLMFFIIIGYAGQVANDIAQEKSSRVIEMIVSSISPTTHLLAKVSAIILSALTQIIVMIIGGFIAYKTSSINEALDEFHLKFSNDSLQMIIVCIIYLLLGLLLYLSLAAMLGSFVSRMEDLQQSIMPLTFLSIGGFYVAIFNILTPDSTLVKFASYFPFFTPFVMPLRMLDENNTIMIQIIGISILIVMIVLVVLLTTYIYKRSILLTESGMMKSVKKIFNK